MKSIFTIVSLALVLVTPAFAGIEWGFDTSANPASATVGTGNAAITLGTMGTGWHSGTSVPWNSYGGATGFWDIGSAGSILLNSFSGSGLTTLTVFQWVVPGGTVNNPYNGNLGFAVSGGPSGTLSPVVPVTGIGWWEFTASLGALDPADVTITASAGGAIIDRLTLVPEPATWIAGSILLVPFLLSTWPILRRRKTS